MNLSDWFKGFEKGISCLSSEQRTSFFSECGKKLCEMWDSANLSGTV